MKPVSLRTQRLPQRLLIVDALSFQLLWFVAAQGDNAFAAVATVIHILLYQRLHAATKIQWYFIAAVAMFGMLLDTLLGTLNLIAFHSALPLAISEWELQIAPLWMGCLWLGFATTLLRSLYFLADRRVLAALVGACAGPLSYYAGAALSGSTFGKPTHVVLIVEAVVWAALLPSLLYCARAVQSRHELVNGASVEHADIVHPSATAKRKRYEPE